MAELIESSTFVSHGARMSGEFDSKKDSQSIKFKQRPQIFAKLSFKELCDSKLSDLHPSNDMATIYWVKIRLKNRKVGCEFMRHQSLK